MDYTFLCNTSLSLVYGKLLEKNIEDLKYKKIEESEIVRDVKVQQEIVKNLNIEDRVMYVPPKKSFVTLKDHKDNFVNDPKCRLLNPTKIEIGKISKQILSRVVEALRVKTELGLWKNTDSCIEWFENLHNKKELKFVTFDIDDYYSSISEKLFCDALNWAKSIVNLTSEEIEIIKHLFSMMAKIFGRKVVTLIFKWVLGIQLNPLMLLVCFC